MNTYLLYTIDSNNDWKKCVYVGRHVLLSLLSLMSDDKINYLPQVARIT